MNDHTESTIEARYSGDLWDDIWQQLNQAVTDPRHQWRRPVAATVDERGLPRARTLVLRGVDQQRKKLFFYTDHRSPKSSQLSNTPYAALVFFDPLLNWQLRIEADIRVLCSGPEVEKAWQDVRHRASAADYLSLDAPGSPLSNEERLPPGQHALGIMEASVREMDWLELSRDGHVRALVSEADVCWLVP